MHAKQMIVFFISNELWLVSENPVLLIKFSIKRYKSN